MAVTTEPPWLNRTQGISGRNGTTTHTITLGFTPTSGNFLMVVVGGSVTHTNAGWTERVAPVLTAELSVFTKTSDGTETTFVDTTNATNYAVVWVAYEFPAGTTWTGSTSATPTADTWSQLTGLPGTEQVVFAGMGRLCAWDNATLTATWTAPWVEDSEQTFASNVAGTESDGYGLILGHQINVTAASVTPAATVAYGGTGTTATNFGSSDRQTITWALNVASGSTPHTRTPTSAAAAADSYSLLSPPLALSATMVSASRIDLAWSPVAGATGYVIERDGVVIASNHPSATYSDTGLAANRNYRYTVRTRMTVQV